MCLISLRFVGREGSPGGNPKSRPSADFVSFEQKGLRDRREGEISYKQHQSWSSLHMKVDLALMAVNEGRRRKINRAK